MPQDAFTLRYLCEELDAEFKGGKVNRIIQPAPEEVVFTVYTGTKTQRLYISVNPACPRIGIDNADRESPLTAPNFCMLLRKHLLSATVDGVSLVGFDRIVRIDFSASSEFFDAGKRTLFIELMGRYSNIILTENGKVSGGNRGVNFFDNGVRPLIVGRDYALPPSGDKKEPSDKSLIEYFARYQSGGEKLSDYLVKGVRGISSDTAAEAVSEYCKTRPQFNAAEFYAFINDFAYRRKKQPCVIYNGGDVKDVCAFPYSVIAGEPKFFASLAEAEDVFFREKETAKRFREKKERVVAVVSSAIKKVKKRLSAINARLFDAENGEKERVNGELILANIYKIKQGDKSVAVTDYYDGTEKTISLDPALTPAQNAERYYKRYNKAKRTLVAQLPQKEFAEAELAYLNGVNDEIALAENASDAVLIAEELKAAGYIAKEKLQQKRRKEPAKYRVYAIDGFTVKVGRNNVENDELTFSAKGGDLWLHAKDYHSSHVIIEAEGKDVPETTIITAAEICAYYGKGREGGKSDVVYTKKKFVKKPPKSKPGFCTYTDFKTVTVKPDAHEELLKQR